MNAQRWQQVRALFDEWVDLPPDARQARLSECAVADPTLAAEVARMLDADSARDTARFEALAMHAADAVVARSDDSGRQIGPWRLLRTLGSGGMGTVYLGERQTPNFTQQAAIKLLRVGWNGSDARRRFEAEQRVLASLQHPHIAHLIDGGIDGDGTPYLALEYVDGLPLNEHADQAGLSPPARVRLFLAVCAAVEHAHQHLVVHRDLKPGNILVDRQGAIKLLDFGIAKLLDADGAAALTSTGVRLYTPGYAAPEQLRGAVVSTATDVYALGVVLYELLTGVLPFEVASASAVDWERVVLTQEPQPPSRQSRRTRLGTLQPVAAWPTGWAGDIDAIVLKAIRREPELRYSSVAELRNDLIALLDGRPVAARRGSRRYRWNKLLRRHALALGLGSIAVVALLVGTGISLWQAREAQAARLRAEASTAEARAAAQRAQATVEFLTDVFAAANPSQDIGPEPTARDLLRAGEQRIADDRELDPLTRASLQQAIGLAHMGLDDVDASERMLLAARASAIASGDLKAEVDAMLPLAIVANLRGRSDEALAQYLAIDRLLQQRGNQDAMLQSQVDSLMAMELLNTDRHVEALQRISRAYASASAVSSALAPDVINTLSVLITALRVNGRGAEGVRYTTPSYQALRQQQKVPPGDQLTVLGSHATALRLAGRLEEALGIAEEALRLRESLDSADTLGVAFSLGVVGSIQRDMQHFEASALTFERALAIRRAKSAPTHSSLLNVQVHAARSWILAGHAERARPLLTAALDGYHASAESDSNSAARAHWWLVRLLLLEGREAEAHRELRSLDLERLESPEREEAQALLAKSETRADKS